MLAGVVVESGLGLGDIRRVPAVSEGGFVAGEQDDRDIGAVGPGAIAVDDPQHGRTVGVWRTQGGWRSPQGVEVVTGGDDGVRLIACLVVEVSSMQFERGEQSHDLTEDLVVALREVGQPRLEDRVVAHLHEMHSTTYAFECIVPVTGGAVRPRWPVRQTAGCRSGRGARPRRWGGASSGRTSPSPSRSG